MSDLREKTAVIPSATGANAPRPAQGFAFFPCLQAFAVELLHRPVRTTPD